MGRSMSGRKPDRQNTTYIEPTKACTIESKGVYLSMRLTDTQTKGFNTHTRIKVVLPLLAFCFSASNKCDVKPITTNTSHSSKQHWSEDSCFGESHQLPHHSPLSLQLHTPTQHPGLDCQPGFCCLPSIVQPPALEGREERQQLQVRLAGWPFTTAWHAGPKAHLPS